MDPKKDIPPKNRWFHQTISALFNPALLPFFGTLYYFSIEPVELPKELQYKIAGMVLFSTLVIPFSLLAVLKKLRKIQHFDLPNSHERKGPLVFSIVLFYLLANELGKIPSLLPLKHLFMGVGTALCVAYLLTNQKYKISIHMIGMGTLVGFVVLMGLMTGQNQLISIALLFFVSGLTGQARLRLNAHHPREVYLGFWLGLLTQCLSFWFLYGN